MVRVVKSPEERRQEIVEAACQLFLQKGYESTTMQDIIRQVGIAKGTVYHYFRAKEELLEAVLEMIVEAEKERLTDLFAGLRGNALEKMRGLIAGIGADHHDEELITNLHQPANAGMHIRLQAMTLLMLTPFFSRLIEQGQKEGLFLAEHPTQTAEFILAATTFLTDLGIYPWDAAQLEKRIRAMPELIERLLGAPAGAFSFLGDDIRQAMHHYEEENGQPAP